LYDCLPLPPAELRSSSSMKKPNVLVRCLRLPESGAPPVLVSLPTVVERDGPSCFLLHTPDFRAHWHNERLAWRYLDLAILPVPPSLDDGSGAVYYVFYSFYQDGSLNANAHISHTWGDVFVVRVSATEFNEDGWTEYEDVPEAFLNYPATGWRGIVRCVVP
jgi:hypothetical protein